MLSGYDLGKLIEDVGDAYRVDEVVENVLLKDPAEVVSILVEVYGFLTGLKDSSMEQLLDYFKP